MRNRGVPDDHKPPPRVMLECTRCKRTKSAALDATDPPGCATIKMLCYAAIYRNIWGLYDSNAAPQAVTGSAPQSDGSGDYGLTGSGPAVAAPKGGMAMLMDTDGPRMQGVIRALRQWIGFQSNDNAAELHRQAVLLFGLDIIHGDHDDE
jgi:hypothetical protein